MDGYDDASAQQRPEPGDGTLKALRARYERLFDDAPVGYVMMDRAGCIRQANQAFARMVAAEPAALLGTPMVELVEPSDRIGFRMEFVELASGPAGGRVEVRLAGNGTFALLEGRPFEPELGAARSARVLVAATDITDRKRAEEALRVSEERYRTLVEASPVPIIVHAEERVCFANAAALEAFGAVSLDEVVGTRIWDYVHPDFRAIAGERVRSIYRGRTANYLVEKFVRADGTVFDVEVFGSRVEYDGKPASQVVFRDISARRRAEDERDRILDLSLDLICVVGTDGYFKYVNPAWERLLGYPRKELLARPAIDLVHPDDTAKHASMVERLLAGQATTGVETRYETKGGRGVRTISWAGRRSRERGLCYCIGRDVTARKAHESERRRLEEQLRDAQKLESLGVLAGGIAHDFANTLQTIVGNASLALEDSPEDGSSRDALEQIEAAAERATVLCKQMLAYAGKGRFIVQRVGLNAVLTAMRAMLAASVSKKAELRFELTAPLPAIEGDSDQLGQVILNLVTNASDALSDELGTITVRTRQVEADRGLLARTYLDEGLQEGSYVALEVSDDGCGMDADTRAKMFDPFFTTKFTGRGLGLAAVLGVVRGHHGAIGVETVGGEGTTVQVLLPAAPAVAPAEQPAGESERPAAWRGSGTVLLVDDEAGVRVFAKHTLQRAGFDVLMAADGFEAVEVFARRAGDIVCVVLDLTMPRMDGEEAFRELRKIRPDVPVILSSGYSEHVTDRFSDQELAGFIQKPYRPRELIAQLRRILE